MMSPLWKTVQHFTLCTSSFTGHGILKTEVSAQTKICMRCPTSIIGDTAEREQCECPSAEEGTRQLCCVCQENPVRPWQGLECDVSCSTGACQGRRRTPALGPLGKMSQISQSTEVESGLLLSWRPQVCVVGRVERLLVLCGL